MAVVSNPARGTTIALIVASAMFMQNLDSAIINTSLPKMALSFGVSSVDLSLGITAYMLASAAISPLASWLSDRFGARGVLAGSVMIFTLASVGCGMATDLPLFVIARLLQGTGGALMMPVGMEVVLRTTAKSELMRATALTVWPALVAPILGPVLGGFITQTFDWRWNFWLNLPIGLAGTIAVLICIPKSAAEHVRKLDLSGFVLCSVALACLLAGFQRSSVPGSARTMAIGLVAVGFGAGVMAIRHLRSSPAPLLALGPLSRTSFSYSALLPGALFRGMFATAPFLLPLLFQLGFGLSPCELLQRFAGGVIDAGLRFHHSRDPEIAVGPAVVRGGRRALDADDQSDDLDLRRHSGAGKERRVDFAFDAAANRGGGGGGGGRFLAGAVCGT